MHHCIPSEKRWTIHGIGDRKKAKNEVGQNQALRQSQTNIPSNTKVIACKVFKDELEYLSVGKSNCVFLDQELHRFPSDLHQRLQETICEVEKEYQPEQIILVYGHCGRATENLSTKKADLILTRVSDCVPLLLGREPERISADGKGIYYLSRGWIAYGKNPYVEYLELRERFGHEDAYWSCKELLKHYNHVVSIKTILDSSLFFQERAKEFADFFGMELSETGGDLRLLKRLIRGQPDGWIFKVSPQQKISCGDFLTHS